MPSILITGGAGFIGSHVTREFVRKKYKVFVIDNFSTGSHKNLSSVFKKITLFSLDLSDPYTVEKIKKIKKVDYVVHIAALPRIGKSLDSPFDTHQANTTATLQTLLLAHILHAKKMVYISSSSVYGRSKILPLTEDMNLNPLNPYALQKLISEQYCKIYSQIYDLPVVVLRLFNVYGPDMQFDGGYKLVFANWIESIKKNQPIKIFGDGNQTRDFTYVDDVVSAIEKSTKLKTGRNFEVFNICSGKETSVNTLAKLFGQNPIFEENTKSKFEERYKYGSFSKAQKILGWQPHVFIEEGVEKIKESYGLPVKGLIVVPAFNEESVLDKVLKKIPKRIASIPFDVVVINDGSHDKTEKVAKKNKVTVLSHPINRGLGAALGTGFAYARLKKYDYLITLDGDGQHDPLEIEKLLQTMKKSGADFVVGSRIQRRGMPVSRRIITSFASFATFLFTGVWTTDSQSGFRLFSKRAIEKISVQVDRMEVSSAFFQQVKKNNLKMQEVSIKPIYTKYSMKKGQNYFNSFNILGKLALATLRE